MKAVLVGCTNYRVRGKAFAVGVAAEVEDDLGNYLKEVTLNGVPLFEVDGEVRSPVEVVMEGTLGEDLGGEAGQGEEGQGNLNLSDTSGDTTNQGGDDEAAKALAAAEAAAAEEAAKAATKAEATPKPKKTLVIGPKPADTSGDTTTI